MKSLMMLAAGCILAIGVTACETKTEEPATVDTTAMAPVDTVLLDRKDTAIITQDTVITQDTTIKPGKTATTGDVKKPAKTTTTTKPVAGENKSTGSETRRTVPPENTGTESKPRR